MYAGFWRRLAAALLDLMIVIVPVVVLGIVVALTFTKSMSRQVTTTGEVVGGGTKATAVFLVILWCVIMTCGRWIAYAPA